MNEDVDEVIAVNIDGHANSPAFTIKEMAYIPGGGIESYPEIVWSGYSVVENLADLNIFAAATVTDDYYEITDVYLLDSTEQLIGEMEYNSGLGQYTYSEVIDPDFQPSENEKIRAYNSEGYFTTTAIPADSYGYPSKTWKSYSGYFDFHRCNFRKSSHPLILNLLLCPQCWW